MSNQMDPILLEFLRSGRLGELAAGARREHVKSRLGPPESISDPDWVEIWKYDSVQLVFQHEMLKAIYVYFDDLYCLLPQSIQPARSRLDAPKMDNLLEEMRINGIQFQHDHELTFDDQVSVISEGGVNLTFDGPTNLLVKLTTDFDMAERRRKNLAGGS